MRKKTEETPEVSTEVAEKPKRKVTRAKKKDAPAATEVVEVKAVETKKEEGQPMAEPVQKTAPETEPAQEKASVTEPAQEKIPVAKAKTGKQKAEKPKVVRKLVPINDFCDLTNYGYGFPILNEQQIQGLDAEEAKLRCERLEDVIRRVLDYDVVISDTNIWLELLVGKTSSHSDPRINARLAFERQLETISRLMKRIGSKFMLMSETYEEIDRFASQQDPVNYDEADWDDEILRRNAAARLSKRLILAQQKENRLRIEGIGSESHHGSFADPAIIRRVVELFAQGKKVLLLTNDASVGIRSLGMCDDLQRTNNINDALWHEVYEPQRPMVLTMDDLKMVDLYTRQYHFLSVAAGRNWMQDVEMRKPTTLEKPLQLWKEGFRAGDHHERRSDRLEQQRKEQQQKKEEQRREQQRQEQEKREQERREQQRLEQEKRAEQRREQQRQEQERRNQQRQEQERRNQERREQQRQEQVPMQPVQDTPAPEAAEEKSNASTATANAIAPKTVSTASSAVPAAEKATPAAEGAPAIELPEFSDVLEPISSIPQEPKRPQHRSNRRKPAPKPKKSAE